MPTFHSNTTSAGQLTRNLLPAFFTLLALAAALNLQGHEYSYRWLLLALLLLSGLLTSKIHAGYQHSLTLPAGGPIAGYALFCLWATLSLLWSPAPGDSLLVLLNFLAGLPAMLLGFWARRRQRYYFTLLLIPLALLLIGLSSYQAFILDIQRPAGLMLNWNTNAAFIAMLALPCCATFLVRAMQGKNTWPAGLFIAASTFAMALSLSRGVLLGSSLGLALLLVAGWKNGSAGKTLLALSAWFFAGYLLGDLLHGGGLSGRLFHPAGGAGITTVSSGRNRLWAIGWQMYLDRPWLGWGLGAYPWLYPQYRLSADGYEIGQFVHSDFLQFLLELGPTGLLAFLLFLVLLGRQAWNSYHRSGNARHRLPDLGYFAAILALLAHTAFSFDLHHPAVIILLGLYTGMLSRHAPKAAVINILPKRYMTRSGYYSILGTLALAGCLGLLSLSIGFHAVHQATLANSPGARMRHLLTAERYTPFMEINYSYQAAVVIDMLKNPKNHISLDDARDLVAYGLAKADLAIAKNPLKSANYRLKADLLSASAASAAEQRQVIDNYQHCLRLNPYDIDARMHLVAFLESIGQEQESFRVLFAGLNKGYRAKFKKGLLLLLKIDHSIELSASKAQKRILREQIDGLSEAMLRTHNATGFFVLKGLGIDT